VSGTTSACCVDCTFRNESGECRAERSQGTEGADDGTDDAGSSSSAAAAIALVVAVMFCAAGVFAMWFTRRKLEAANNSGGTSGGTIEAISMRSLDHQYVEPPSKGSSTSGQGSTISTTTFSTFGAPEELLISGADLTCTTKLGEGAFGIVRQGRWNDKMVAVKQVKGTEAEALRQLLDEGKKLIKLPPHDNLVTFYGVCDSPPSIVLQFCDGGSLLDRLYGPRALHSTPLTKLEQASISLAVARGLHHLHKARIVHRDIAARNVLLHEGVPKVTDMGMARDSAAGEGDAAAYYQQTTTTTGPLKWMAPEQLKKRSVSYKADVYSYGILLFELWGRQEPWSGKSAIEAAAAVLAGTTHRVPSAAPAAVAATMTATFESDPHARPSTHRIVDALSHADFEVTQDEESVRAFRAAHFERDGGEPVTPFAPAGYEAPPKDRTLEAE
jgi:hypothetical protein